MADTPTSLPDFKNGFPLQALQDGGKVLGRVGDDEVLLVRHGDLVSAIGPHCTHYHGPLADGLVVGDTIRCPWHHSCFSLKTGEAVRAPALDPVPCWRVDRIGDAAYVTERQTEAARPARPGSGSVPASIVIVGGGAAGLAAADILRRERYDGPITMFSADNDPPVDRPNLSKDYLAGTAQEDWMPLRSPDFYTEQRIELMLKTRVATLEPKQKYIQLENGQRHSFDALLIATGADPVHLDIPGASGPQVFYLRTFADSRAIIANAASAKSVVVVGASFIGLEVAASLRTRGINVQVVAPEKQPLERVMGPEVGRLIRKVHEEHGVTFHLESSVSRVDGRVVTLTNGPTLDADFVVFGVGVRPSIGLAERAGLAVDRGIAVNEYLETSVPGIYAAGDIARWPDPHTGDRIRVEHFVVAERQGQTAARNMLGYRERFDAVPFFWSQHYDVTINYVGHAERWDRIDVDGSLDARDCAVTYMRGDRALAVATVSRDMLSLEAEALMEKQVNEGALRTAPLK
jgi:NADPH-dependent 2,4-dienoyl-CoA reductase/sulfur reductase-like enzyme/nitrite reductase/ring-hydroxylating ferredoxin subunit